MDKQIIDIIGQTVLRNKMDNAERQTNETLLCLNFKINWPTVACLQEIET